MKIPGQLLLLAIVVAVGIALVGGLVVLQDVLDHSLLPRW